MSIITIDFETYYDKDYSLSKMTTEEYINDPRFEVIGVGMKVDDGPTYWFTDKFIEPALKLDWENHAILCHNTLFDGAILSWKYGVKPGMWFDTLSMAKALHGSDAGGSLKALAERYQVGVKGDEVLNALGKRRKDFSDADLDRYGDYCRNDVDVCRRLFDAMSRSFPDSEFGLIDLTIRMYTEPSLMVDADLLVQRLEQVKKDKQSMLRGLMDFLEVGNEEEVQKKLGSNPQFAQLLKDYGVEPPMKVSPTTGKETYAFAKTDSGFISLQEHPDFEVQQLCAVRLGTKSTLEESRIERFIAIGGRNHSYLPVPLRYYGAHTGRWSGSDKVNFQNLPSRNKEKKALKNAIVAPPGHVIINADSSQIEARVLAWFAEQNDLVRQFANGEDVYSTFASKVFGKPISKANPVERFVGKTCILGLGYGTGFKKLHDTLKLGGADLDAAECERIVRLYRQENHRIVELWRECDLALGSLTSNVGKPFGLGREVDEDYPVMIEPSKGVLLPNNLHIRYPNLRTREGKYVYDSRKGPINIWGGGMVENVVQALARIIVGEQMMAISSRYPIALTVHDAAVCVVREVDLDAAVQWITQCMSTPPDWGRGLPVTCEVKWGRSYGDC